MTRGVLACMLAGAIWGGIFAGPRLLPQYDGATFALSRYLVFGLLSCVLFAWAHRRAPVRIAARDARTASMLGLIGNVLYFIALVTAVQWTGIAYTSLIVGMLPVTTTLVADWQERRAGRPTVPLRRQAWPLGVIAAGVAAVNLDLYLQQSGAATQPAARTLAGVAAAFLALAAWTYYSVANLNHMRATAGRDSGDWATLQGIGTLFWVVVALGAWWIAAQAGGGIAGPHLLRALADPSFLAWCLYLGVVASWLGTALWNYGAKALPATLSGQMIVFETLFAQFYGFAVERRGPRPLEAVAILCLLGGIVWASRMHAPQTSDGRLSGTA